MARETKPTQEIRPGLVISNEDLIKARTKERQAARLNEAMEARQLKAAQRHDHWQSIADNVWATNPHLSKSAVATRVANQTGDKVRTVRRVIRKK